MPTSAPFCELCQAPAPLTCSGCFAVQYCSREHQRAAWSQHSAKCRPYMIRTTPELGRHLIASRDLEEGEIIIVESPFVVGPRHFLPKPCCVGCSRKVGPDPKRCRRCNWPVCSSGCLGLKGPGSHELECSLLKSLTRVILICPDHYLVPLRCTFLQTQDPEKWRWIEEQFPFAETGKEDFENDRIVSNLETLLTPLPKVVPHLVFDCSPATVRRLLNVLDAFALDGSAPNVAPISGLYTVASLLRHKCNANTLLLFENAPEALGNAAKFTPGRVTVKAAHKIKQGEILTRNSSFAFFPTLARLGSQRVRRNFRCTCSRCMDPHENGSDLGTLRCPRCPGSIVPVNTAKIESSPWKCDGPCEFTVAAEIAVNLVNELSGLITASAKEDADVFQLEILLKTFEEHLHRNHALCFAVKSRLFKMIGRGKELSEVDDADLDWKAVLGHNIVDLMNILGPSQIHQEVIHKAECFLELAKAGAEITRRRFSSGAWSTDRCLLAISECCIILRRILNFVCFNPREPLNSHYEIVRQIGPEIHTIFCWLKENKLEVPDELKRFFQQ